jgi:hypothetical protein
MEHCERWKKAMCLALEKKRVSNLPVSPVKIQNCINISECLCNCIFAHGPSVI